MSAQSACAERSSLRSQAGLVCPHCRATHETEQASHTIVRCPADNYAFVRAEALADADGDPFLGRTIGGRYVILGKLGAGSMGTVYRARHESLGRDVAVKILREGRVAFENARERFGREARALSMLASPYTVTVYDFGEIPVDPEGDELGAGMSLYLAMELLEGESLGERLEHTPRLAIDEAARVARHALLSLTEAHEKGVIHRDLKPDNIFLGRSTSGKLHCKLLDFSIAKVMNDPAPRVSVLETQEGTVFGTPRYMSPEQAQGRALDARSDLYSIGVLLYQMLTGRPPFTDEDAVIVMAHHIRSKPAPPTEVAPDAGIPEPLSDLVLRALAKDPAKRPATARVFIEELDQAIGRRDPGDGSRPSYVGPPPVDRVSSVPAPPVPAEPVSSVPAPPVPAEPVSSVPASLPPPAHEPEPSREAPEPNSVSSPPPKSISVRPARAPGLFHALVGVAAIAAGVLVGVLAFTLAHAPRRPSIAADDAALRDVAVRVSSAVDHAKADAEPREPPRDPGEDLGAEPAEGAVLGSEVGSGAANAQAPALAPVASPAPSSSRAFGAPPPPPALPRRRFNK